MTYLKRFAAAGLVIILGFIAQPALAVGHKIIFSNGNLELELGASTTITVSLDEPIVCPSQVTCDVVVDFGGSLPQGISISPTTVSWATSEWTQTRTITVTVDESAENLVGQTAQIGATVTSASEYYSGYAPSFGVTVSAAAVPPIVYDQPTLSNTGSNDLLFFTSGLFLVGAGFAAFRAGKKGALK